MKLRALRPLFLPIGPPVQEGDPFETDAHTGAMLVGRGDAERDGAESSSVDSSGPPLQIDMATPVAPVVMTPATESHLPTKPKKGKR